MRSLRILTAAMALLSPGLLAAHAGGKPARPIVVELYTSQGCSSCPPADAFLNQLADRKDVIAMSLPITYWDMLGWKDTLASDADTHRQEAYANVMGRGGVYTPQMIVDGVDDVVGSKEAQVDADISTREADMKAVPVNISLTPEYIHVVVGASAKPATPATIWLFRILSHSTVNVGGGENQGKKLAYRNVVRDVRAIGNWDGESVSIAMPRRDMNVTYDDVAVVLQQGSGYGRVIGADLLSRDANASSR